MRTPYCAALRLSGQEIDQLRSAIGEAQHQLAMADGAMSDLRTARLGERLVACSDWAVGPTGWFDKVSADLERLGQARTETLQRIDQLRDKASELLASRRALEDVAEQFRIAARRRVEQREQSAADDRAAVNFIATRRAVTGA